MKVTRYWIPVFLGFSLIFYLSSLPQDELPQFSFPYLDKIVHFVMYFGLGLLVARALTARIRTAASFQDFRNFILLSIIIVSAYGATDEWHQSTTPGRSAEFLDLIADILGAIAGSFCVVPYRRWVLRLENSMR